MESKLDRPEPEDYSEGMTRVRIGGCLLLVLLSISAQAWAESPSFDPDQPFTRGWSTHQLRSWLNRALDALEDHVDITAGADGQDQRRRFEFKFYPKGKSQSDEHVGAEGWFRRSPNGDRQDFHLRFHRSHDSAARPAPPDVL